MYSKHTIIILIFLVLISSNLFSCKNKNGDTQDTTPSSPNDICTGNGCSYANMIYKDKTIEIKNTASSNLVVTVTFADVAGGCSISKSLELRASEVGSIGLPQGLAGYCKIKAVLRY